MDIELRELSAIYQNLQEEEEEGGGADVGAHAKAIRYQSRRDGVPLPKAFNDYVSKNQLSGTERTALRQKLGFMGEETEVLDEKKGCNHSHEGEECEVHGKKECPVKEATDYKERDKILNKAKPLHKHLYKNLHKGDTKGDVNEHVSWRTDLAEYVGGSVSPKAKTEDKSKEKISEKNVKNKIVINPPQGMTEAIEEIGGQILEMTEIEEMQSPDQMNQDEKKQESMRRKQLAAKEQMMKKQQNLDKQKLAKQKNLKMASAAMESTEDSLRDRRMERGGVDGNVDYKRPPGKPNTFGKKPSDPNAKSKAMQAVKDSITAKYGKGAIYVPKKKG